MGCLWWLAVLLVPGSRDGGPAVAGLDSGIMGLREESTGSREQAINLLRLCRREFF